MRTKYLILIMIGISVKSFSQFTVETVSNTVNEATSVFVADIDGDNDLDILAASWKDDKIVWFENTNGNGDFGSPQTITTYADGADCVRAYDLDGDGDMDVLSASYYDNKVAWYENTDGKGTFGEQKIISLDLIYGSFVNAGDLDGDGDMDVLSASIDDNKIAWYENTDGKGTFGIQQVIASPIAPNSVLAADIDGDGDLDVLFDASTGNEVAWCENTNGQGSFGEKKIIVEGYDIIHQPSSVSVADIDGDGYLDVLATSIRDDKVSWYKNLDGKGNFGTQQIVSDNAIEARSAVAADFNNDGTLDVVAASWASNVIAWYPNTDGKGTFGQQQIITLYAKNASGVYIGDFNRDGGIDVVSSSYRDNTIAWYKNINVPNALNKEIFNNCSVFPNPTKNFININSKIAISKIDIYNQLGQKVISKINTEQIDVSELSIGIYTLIITDKNNQIRTAKISKQ